MRKIALQEIEMRPAGIGSLPMNLTMAGTAGGTIAPLNADGVARRPYWVQGFKARKISFRGILTPLRRRTGTVGVELTSLNPLQKPTIGSEKQAASRRLLRFIKPTLNATSSPESFWIFTNHRPCGVEAAPLDGAGTLQPASNSGNRQPIELQRAGIPVGETEAGLGAGGFSQS